MRRIMPEIHPSSFSAMAISERAPSMTYPASSLWKMMPTSTTVTSWRLRNPVFLGSAWDSAFTDCLGVANMRGKSGITKLWNAFYPLEGIFESIISASLNRDYPLPLWGFVMSITGTAMILVGDFFLYPDSCDTPRPFIVWGTVLIFCSFFIFIPALLYIIFVKGTSTTWHGFAITILQPLVSFFLLFLCMVVTKFDMFMCAF